MYDSWKMCPTWLYLSFCVFVEKKSSDQIYKIATNKAPNKSTLSLLVMQQIV